MKRLITVAALLSLCGALKAQDSELYLLFEFMKVQPGNESAYLETEDFWAGIHRQRVLAGETLGWDLWSLQPSGTDQGYQYLTVNLFESLEAMMRGSSASQLVAHAKKAYPDMTEEEIMAKWNATPNSRDLAVRVFLSRIEMTTGGTEMKEGTVATLAYMKEKDPAYEKMESEIFKPWHQQMVDAGAKSSWGVLRILLPAGSDRYASHIVTNMYDDISQYVKAMDYEGGESSLMTNLAVREGLKTRDMKSVKLATLVRMVRK